MEVFVDEKGKIYREFRYYGIILDVRDLFCFKIVKDKVVKIKRVF